MSNITASLVKELRERTQLGMMTCKQALVASDGDIEKAIENLRKSSALKAAKKADNVTAEGVVAVKVSSDNKFVAIIEINSQTDFASRDNNFQSFVDELLEKTVQQRITSLSSLLTEEVIQARDDLVTKIGENINIRRLDTIVANDEQVIGKYVHTNQRIGAIILLSGGNSNVANSIAMHIAASKPLVLKPEDVSAELISKERDIYLNQAQDSGKPAEIISKMVEGKVKKFLAEISLTQQNFVVDPSKKVQEILQESNCQAVKFSCFTVGEGIEKKEVNFADEVKAQAGL